MASNATALPKPATADTGFIFSMPEREHPLTADAAFLRVLSCNKTPKVLFREGHVSLTDLVTQGTCRTTFCRP